MWRIFYRQDIWIIKIIGYRRFTIKSLRVKLSLIWNFDQVRTLKLLHCQILHYRNKFES